MPRRAANKLVTPISSYWSYHLYHIAIALYGGTDLRPQIFRLITNRPITSCPHIASSRPKYISIMS